MHRIFDENMILHPSNFREIAMGKIAPGTLYRSSHPGYWKIVKPDRFLWGFVIDMFSRIMGKPVQAQGDLTGTGGQLSY
jgi:hypothetical protein